MNIGYFVFPEPQAGIARKLFQQINCLNSIEQVNSAKLFVLTKGDYRVSPITNLANIQITNLGNKNKNHYANSYLFYKKLYNRIDAEIKKHDFDVILFRGTPSDHFIYNFVRKSHIRPIFELNSIKYYEHLLQNRRLLGWYGKENSRKTLQISGGFIAVTKEIQEYYLQLVGNEVPSIAIGNGFNVEDVPLHTPPAFDGRNLRIIAVSNWAPWHGLDRFIRGLHEYSGGLDISLSVVGDGKILPELHAMVRSYKMEEKVKFYGFLSGKKLDELFDQNHLALGALALDRKMLTEASPIKSREYLSRGIPFIYSSYDYDLDRSPPDGKFYLNLPQNEQEADLTHVEKFAKESLNIDKLPEKMRKFSKERIDMSIKMREVYQFLESIR